MEVKSNEYWYCDAKKAPKLLNQSWWHKANGYSYFSGNGQMYYRKTDADKGTLQYGGFDFGEEYETMTL